MEKVVTASSVGQGSRLQAKRERTARVGALSGTSHGSLAHAACSTPRHAARRQDDDEAAGEMRPPGTMLGSSGRSARGRGRGGTWDMSTRGSISDLVDARDPLLGAELGGGNRRLPFFLDNAT